MSEKFCNTPLGKEPINLGELREFGARHGSLGRDETSARIGKAADRIEWLEAFVQRVRDAAERAGVDWMDDDPGGNMLDEIKALRERNALPSETMEVEHLRAALTQIAVLAEYGTTGPDTEPPCKSVALTAEKATSLRGSISKIARDALK